MSTPILGEASLSDVPARTDPSRATRPGPERPSTAFLDGLRGLAALYVCIHHASYLLHEGYFLRVLSDKFPSVSLASWHSKVLFFSLAPFRWGDAAVVFFFVLSGFVIHLRFATDLRRNGPAARFGWLAYVRRRAIRLFPPLLFALLVTFLCDSIGARSGLAPYANQALYSNTVHYDPHAYSAATLLGNLAFLMTIYVPVFGTNSPLWSLAYEWWFYMAYPALWAMTRRSILLATSILLLLFAASFLPALWPVRLPRLIFGAILPWWIGVLLADVYAGRLRLQFSRLALLLLLAPFAVLPGVPASIRVIAEALTYAGGISLCFSLQQRGWKLRALSGLKALGDSSYTLYVTHMPLLLLISGLMMRANPDHRLPRSPLATIAAVVAITAFAYAAHWITERPFTRRQKPASLSGRTPLSPTPFVP